MTQILRITSRRAGFRRCGAAHLAVATDHARTRWSAEEIEQLKAEPMLIVEEVDVAAPKAPKDPAEPPNAEVERQHRIRAVMRKLDRGQKEHFTASGKPKAETLEEMTGLEAISAKERDALWAEVLIED